MPLSQQQTADIQKQYDPMRKRAQQQEAANLGQQNDAMARRAAQLGGGPSGALIKQESLAQDASAKRLASANEGIDAQQQGAINQARQVQEQRDWQTSERVAGQQHQTSERMGSQDWQAGQSDKLMKHQTSERLGSQDWQAGQADKQRKWSTGERVDQQRQQDRQFQQQLDRDYERFLHEKDVDAFNMDMAEKMFNKKDMLEQLFGNIGGGYQQFDQWVGGLPTWVGGGGVGGIGKKVGF